jgi:hypothetical protein
LLAAVVVGFKAPAAAPVVVVVLVVIAQTLHFLLPQVLDTQSQLAAAVLDLLQEHQTILLLAVVLLYFRLFHRLEEAHLP